MELATTDPATVPKRRRWRWLVFGLFVAAAGVWLAVAGGQHPTEMIGRWRHINASSPKKALPDLLLRADGSGEFVTTKGGSPMTWWADGPLVVMRHDPRSAAEWLAFALGEIDARVRNTGWRRPQVRLYVTSLTPGRILFSWIEPQETTRDASDPEDLLIRIEE